MSAHHAASAQPVRRPRSAEPARSAKKRAVRTEPSAHSRMMDEIDSRLAELKIRSDALTKRINELLERVS